MAFDLAAYLARIGLEGPVAPDLVTLRRVHRAHLLAIPYENLDVQLARPVSLDPDNIADKIVGRRRGGWCYEMNGLLGAALKAIGFQVTRMAGGVHRATVGDVAIGNHLVLKVDLDRPYLCDAGFGDGILEPIPFAAGTYEQGGYTFRLERLDDGYFRLHNHPLGGAPSFDVADAPADEALLAASCQRLQTDPASQFVLNATAQRHVPGGFAILRGRVLKHIRGTTVTEERLASREHFVRTLAEVFSLDLPEAGQLWFKVKARHEAVFGADAE